MLLPAEFLPCTVAVSLFGTLTEVFPGHQDDRRTDSQEDRQADRQEAERCLLERCAHLLPETITLIYFNK